MYTVIGAFDDRQSAQRTVEALVEQGIPRASIDLQSTPDTLDSSASSVPRYDAGNAADGDRDEGFLGGVRHFFASLFGNDADAQVGIYSEAVRRGSTILVVDAADEGLADRAAQLMRDQGGTIDLDERSSAWRSEGWQDGSQHRGVEGGTAGAMALQALSGEERVVHTAPAGADRDLGEQRSGDRDRFTDRDALTGGDRAADLAGADREVVMPVVQEEVKVGKRSVEQGGVRVIRRVTETPISELVRLREERARIERRPVDRAATTADLQNFREDTIEVRERTEEPVVEKVARVVEEVVVGREVSERTERVEDTVRRTDVEVDRLAREADQRLERATGDAWNDEEDKVAGGPNPPPGTQPRERSLGEKLKGATRDDRPTSRH
ncbi:MAG: YsnF/AvaK domain-containing protein [Steroidobacteraceae bacterium]|nr:YsnF/AvaK domain-containing protein [Steroidobacteraceae bacterium]